MGHCLGYIADRCHRPPTSSPAMPELPEVETTRLGITPAILGQRVSGVEIRQPMLRWRIPDDLAQHIVGNTITRVERRGKYLLLQAGTGWVIVHLGMSGSLRVLPSDAPASLHDHVDIVFGPQLLRLRDPRRFGAVLWQEGDAQQHSLLASLGPEPLSEAFTAEHLYQQTRQRRAACRRKSRLPISLSGRPSTTPFSAAQALIGRYAALKATGVAANPLLLLDLAGGLALDTALVLQLCQLYGILRTCAQEVGVVAARLAGGCLLGQR